MSVAFFVAVGFLVAVLVIAEFVWLREEAEEKAGETEVQAARGKRAELYNRIGDKVCRVVYIVAWRD